MNEIWFCYTMLFILMCLFSASMSLSAYFVSHRTTYLGIMAFFIAFCLETSLIFLDEYSYLKPDTLAEIVTFPFLHPWIKLAFSTLFIMSESSANTRAISTANAMKGLRMRSRCCRSVSSAPRRYVQKP